MSVAAHSGRTMPYGGAHVDPEHTVTPSELELLALYASGFSYDEIGRTKFLSPYTVRNKLRAAMLRSGARNPTHLAAVAVQRQIIRLAPSGLFEPVAQDLRIAGD